MAICVHKNVYMTVQQVITITSIIPVTFTVLTQKTHNNYEAGTRENKKVITYLSVRGETRMYVLNPPFH